MKHNNKTAINGGRPDLPYLRDELCDLENRFTPEQINKMIDDAMPKIDWNKSFNELLLFGTTEIKIENDMNWIKISDQLPKEQEEFLVCYITDYMNKPLITFGSLLNGKFIDKCNWDECDGYNVLTKVTHWMPLPDLPEFLNV